ncbi:hypothetical protein [Haloarchaeobius sp. HRN-SO-5]|uniref:hypothetical protein n=1 Tax=Haloarchaeobius sp. HRN-SO-5 TaxID=3446118 RepID=UPI003EBC7FB0
MTRQPNPDQDRTDSAPPTATNPERSMAAVSHTNPYTGESMGQVFEHGVTVVADGGRDPTRDGRRATDSTGDSDHDPSRGQDQMADVSHTAPSTEDANRVFHRGGERGTVRETEY